jgi:hypothetical protein
MNVAQSSEPFCQNCDTDREMIIGFLKDYVIDKKLVTD